MSNLTYLEKEEIIRLERIENAAIQAKEKAKRERLAKVKAKLIKPIAGWTLILPTEEKKQTSGGIHLPDSMDTDLPQTGKVIAVGPPELNEYGTTRKSPVDVGDKVLFKKWGGNETMVDDKKYLFVKFDDFLAIV